MKHLKRWTFWGLVKTDVLDRGIPWTELILRDANMPDDLNLQLSQRVSVALVNRDSACGCAQHVAHGLGGQPVDQAEHAAGMLHHHFPCLASMNQDADYADTLMHVSGHALREAVRAEIKDYLEPVAYLRPHGRVNSESLES